MGDPARSREAPCVRVRFYPSPAARWLRVREPAAYRTSGEQVLVATRATMALALLASSTVSFALSLAAARPVRPVNRVHCSLDTDPPAAYETTPGGLLLKSVTSGSGELPEPGQIVTVKYSTTLLSNGQVFDKIPELSFVLGTVRRQDPGRQFAWGAPSRTLDALPLLQEAMVGMRVGDARRVSVTPSSEFALLPGVTVQLELELVGIKTGRDAERPVDSAVLAVPSWQCRLGSASAR